MVLLFLMVLICYGHSLPNNFFRSSYNVNIENPENLSNFFDYYQNALYSPGQKLSAEDAMTLSNNQDDLYYPVYDIEKGTKLMPQKKAQLFVRFGKRSKSFEPSEKTPRPYFKNGENEKHNKINHM